jgi:cyclopropane fatty-acyl-phospholipid synthase-like methyltransferase
MAQDSSKPDFWNTRFRDRVIPWDAGGVPPDFRAFVPTLGPGTRLLVPGCGSAHEVYYLAERSIEVLAIDFSAEAVERARANLGCVADRVQLADFFAFDHGGRRFDVIYERAFLCALPRRMWADYAARCAELTRPSGTLAGFFFYGTNPKGPPFGTTPEELHGLLDPHFELIEDRLATESLPVFAGGERWQIWRRR